MVRKRKRLIDFCCKAGGTSMGYHMAGYETYGVDIQPQPNFPFQDRFQQSDITRITDRQIASIRKNFDAVSASPPCQPYSVTKSIHKNRENWRHPEIVEFTRWLFNEIDLPWIIENVRGAPLIDPVQVCGSGVGLRILRHRLFESNCDIEGVRCRHEWQERDLRYVKIPNGHGSQFRSGNVGVYGRGDGSHFNGQSQREIWSHAMGIDWMTGREMAQAIPPLYTFHLGKQLIQYV